MSELEARLPLEELDLRGLKNLVESLLFAADTPVTLGELARALERDVASVERALDRLAEECSERGVRVVRQESEVQMVTAPEAAPYLERFFGLGGSSRLSGAALETLAIIAYHQPITRARIEALRGVNCDHVLSMLQARGFIAEVGRLASPGRPVLFGTTLDFLQYLGLERIEELPQYEVEPAPRQATLWGNVEGPAEPKDSEPAIQT